MAQDDYYYEIQLTNKQLIFYFIAAAAGFILSFVAGIMIGRDVNRGDVPDKNATVLEEPSPAVDASPVEDLTYSQRLDARQVVDRLEPTPGGMGPAVPPPTTPQPAAEVRTPAPAPTRAARPQATPRPSTPVARARTPSAPAASRGAFTLQVGAFKDKIAAESLRTRLRGRGFSVSIVPLDKGGGTLYNVRVGSFATRPDAEKVKTRLEAQEKLSSFIVTL